MIEHLCKKDGAQQQEFSKLSQTSPLDNYEFRLSVRRFSTHTTRDAWERVFYELREGDIQWRLQNFMSEKIVAPGAKRPFLVLPGIKGMRPYNPTRVMLQLGRRQTTPIQGDSSSFVIDYNGCIKIPFA